MIRTGMKYGAILIGLYLITYRASESGTLVKNGADGVSSIAKTLQGR